MPSRWKDMVPDEHHNLHMSQVHQILVQMPISELQKYSQAKLRISALRQAGITTVAEVGTFSARDFTTLRGIGPKSAPALETAVRQTIGSVAVSNPPSIGTDDASVRLLVALFTYDHVRNLAQSLAGEREWVDKLATSLRETEPLASRRQWRRATKDQRVSAIGWLPWLQHLVAEEDSARINDALRQASSPLPTREVLEKFMSDPGQAVALLHEALPDATLGVTEPPMGGGQPSPAPGSRAGDDAFPHRESQLLTRLGPYQIKKELGSGFFGNTYLATNPEGVEVALKVLKSEHATQPHLRQSIDKEIRSGQRINSRYFARVLRYDLDADQPWVAQQLIPGQPLAGVVTEQGGLPDSRIRRIMVQIAMALEDLERFRLVHHDLKPENIQLGDNDAVTILDLGVSWAPGDGTTGGDIRYSSPESLSQDFKPNPTSDMWAAGVILTELASGTNPVVSRAQEDPRWNIDSRKALVDAIFQGELDLTKVRSPWQDIIRGMTATDPTNRPSAPTLRYWLEQSGVDSNFGEDQRWIDGLALLLRVSHERGAQMTMEFNHGIYIQWADSGDHLQAEVSSNKFVDARWRLHPEQKRKMQSLGFEPPTRSTTPNWWIQVGPDEGDYGYGRAAEVLVRAVLEVYRVSTEDFAREAGADLIEVLASPSEWFLKDAGVDDS